MAFDVDVRAAFERGRGSQRGSLRPFAKGLSYEGEEAVICVFLALNGGGRVWSIVVRAIYPGKEFNCMHGILCPGGCVSSVAVGRLLQSRLGVQAGQGHAGVGFQGMPAGGLLYLQYGRVEPVQRVANQPSKGSPPNVQWWQNK